MKEMYPAMANSPESVTRGPMTAAATQVEVADGGLFSVLETPYPLTLGKGVTAETVLLKAVEGNMLTVERGFQGNPRTWAAGTVIARNITAYDHDAFKENIEENNACILEHDDTLGKHTDSILNMQESIFELAENMQESMSELAANIPSKASNDKYGLVKGSEEGLVEIVDGIIDIREASIEQNGLLSKEDKIKLENLESGGSSLDTGSQPNFSENDITTVIWSDDLKGNPVLGDGWTVADDTYTHAANKTAPLSFPVNMQQDNYYLMTFTRTGTSVSNHFTIIATDGIQNTDGKIILEDVNFNSSVGFVPEENYTHINIVPKSEWTGNFVFTSIKKATATNSQSMSVKGKDIIVINDNSIFFGDGGKVSTGNRNVANGCGALLHTTTGSDNTAIGNGALNQNINGGYNTAIGGSALAKNISGSSNTAVGEDTLSNNRTGSNNTAIGRSALNGNVTGTQNVAAGNSALKANTTGGYNTAVGYNALNANTTGTYNTAIGNAALPINTTGSQNTAVGSQVLQKNTSGQYNIALGYRALQNNTTGNYNSASGYTALAANTTGTQNTAMGYRALGSNSTASNNTAFGTQALYSNTTGYNNAAQGANALQKNTTGYWNVAMGAGALENNLTGYENVAIGNQALNASINVYNTAVGAYALVTNTGSANTAVGRYAMKDNTKGGVNTAIGEYALRMNTTGDYNIGVGGSSLECNTTGDYNIGIGSNAGSYLSNNNDQSIAKQSVFIGTNSKGSASNNQTNQIVIGYNAIGGGSNTITLGNSSITRLRCQVTSITALSDSRVKEDIEPADVNRCLDTVKQLPLTRYKYKDFTGNHEDKHVTGFLADDMEKVFPKAVSKMDQYFPVLDEEGNHVYEEIEEQVKKTDKQGQEVVETVKRQVEKKFLMKDVKEITPTEILPTAWGAIQALIEKVESLELLLEKADKEIENLKRQMA